MSTNYESLNVSLFVLFVLCIEFQIKCCYEVTYVEWVDEGKQPKRSAEECFQVRSIQNVIWNGNRKCLVVCLSTELFSRIFYLKLVSVGLNNVVENFV